MPRTRSATALFNIPAMTARLSRYDREPLLLRLEREPPPPLLDDERFDDDRFDDDDRLLPLDAPRPFDDRLRLEDERLRPLDDERLPPLADERLRLLADDWLRLLDDCERVFFTSPSSTVPRHSPLSSSSMSTCALKRARSARTARFT